MGNDTGRQYGAQQKVPYRRQRNAHSYYSGGMDKPEICEEKKTEEKATDDNVKNVKASTGGFQLPFGIGEMLDGIDTDKILIIVLLVMIYKDGGSRKLMMALVYLLI